MDNFKQKIEIKDVYGYMDGGTIEVTCENEIKELIKIEFRQKVVFEILVDDKLPGRIYLNNILVPMRSILEKEILERLKETKSKDTLLIESIKYIESEQYILDKDRVIYYKRR